MCGKRKPLVFPHHLIVLGRTMRPTRSHLRLLKLLNGVWGHKLQNSPFSLAHSRIGATTVANPGRNFEYQDTNPRKDCRYAASDGGGALRTASRCSWSGKIPLALIMWPRNHSEVCLKLHFLSFNTSPAFFSFCNTVVRFFSLFSLFSIHNKIIQVIFDTWYPLQDGGHHLLESRGC